MENILILGAYGRLGEELSLALSGPHNIFRHGRNESADVRVESLTAGTIEKLLRELGITVVVNLVAMTDVEKCEKYSF